MLQCIRVRRTTPLDVEAARKCYGQAGMEGWGAQVGDIKETNVSINEGSGQSGQSEVGLGRDVKAWALRGPTSASFPSFDSQERLRNFPDAWTRVDGREMKKSGRGPDAAVI